MRKLSRGAYEDTKGSVRAVESMVEVALLTVVYYLVWRNLYDFSMFAYKGKYVLAGIYAVLLFVLFVAGLVSLAVPLLILALLAAFLWPVFKGICS